MNRIMKFYKTLLGKKMIAAVTGLIMLGFLLGHVAGNLKVFLPVTENGVQDIDEYAHFLRRIGEPIIPAHVALWSVRIGLLISTVLHMTVVIQLAIQNAKARPIGYVVRKHRSASPSARYMLISGLLIAFYIVYHILHLTVGAVQFGDFQEGKVYANLYHSFSVNNWHNSIFNIAMIVILGFHLRHGLWSLFQTLGLDNPDRNRFLRFAADTVSILIVLGFVVVPLSFLLGLMPLPK